VDLPRFLDAFDSGALSAEPSTLVALDPSGAIAWTNPAWTRFALANGGSDVPSRFGVGTSYFEGIGGELRGYFEDAFASCLVDNSPFEQDYECSSADTYRQHHLRVLPIKRSGLLLEHSLVVARPQERLAVRASDPDYRDADGILHQCSNCRRTRSLAGEWNWVPAWVAESPPRTSHGICKVCVGYYWGVRRRKK
jgi:hypothetical protein